MKLISFIKSLLLQPRLFISLAIVIVLFSVSYLVPFLYTLAQIALVLIAVLVGVDGFLLFTNSSISSSRKLDHYFSLGDENPVSLTVTNQYPFEVHLNVYEEVPDEFQWRDNQFSLTLSANRSYTLQYSLRPLNRGLYQFHHTNIIATSILGFISRKYILNQPQHIKVYPSVLQMRHFELLAFSNISRYSGVKKIRRIGHSYEFEQIRLYVQGDDYRSINWKATGRTGSIMINQYQDEKSQPVYCLIDKGRNMKMPFNGLTLVDYAINSSLMISNIALKKGDKAGLLTFSEKKEAFLKADSKTGQIAKILELLYAEKETRQESNYELLYSMVQSHMSNRSLLFLFTNFETKHGMRRVLPILKKLQQRHLLVVVFFENSELVEYSIKRPTDTLSIYDQAIAEKFIDEKKLIANELNRYNVQTILTKPEDLSINTLNKYLELKARGLI